MDNKLVCSAETCVHNIKHLCGASKITVQGGNTSQGEDTFCSTYKEKHAGAFISELGNLNITGGVKQIFSDDIVMDPMVSCTAVQCVYNNREICTAHNLKIAGPSSSASVQTDCETFRAR